MDKSSLKITELPALSVASENGFIPIAQVKEENDTYKTTLRALRESIMFENAYSSTAAGVSATVPGDVFFVYTDETKEHVQGWVNGGGGATPLLNANSEQITYGTYALLNKALKDKGAIVQWVYNGGLSNGGEQTFTVPLTGNVAVQEVYVDGLRQFKDIGFESTGLSFTLAGPVKANQTVVALCFGDDDVEKVNEAFLATYTGPNGASNIGTLLGTTVEAELGKRVLVSNLYSDIGSTLIGRCSNATKLRTIVGKTNDYIELAAVNSGEKQSGGRLCWINDTNLVDDGAVFFRVNTNGGWIRDYSAGIMATWAGDIVNTDDASVNLNKISACFSKYRAPIILPPGNIFIGDTWVFGDADKLSVRGSQGTFLIGKNTDSSGNITNSPIISIAKTGWSTVTVNGQLRTQDIDLRDFVIAGMPYAGTNPSSRDGLFLGGCGWDFQVSRVWFYALGRRAVVAEDLWDGDFIDCKFHEICRDTTFAPADAAPQAMVFKRKVDSCNAVRITNCHFEHCYRGAINVQDLCYSFFLLNNKFEAQNQSSSYPIEYPIYIGNNHRNFVWIGGFCVVSQQAKYIHYARIWGDYTVIRDVKFTSPTNTDGAALLDLSYGNYAVGATVCITGDVRGDIVNASNSPVAPILTRTGKNDFSGTSLKVYNPGLVFSLTGATDGDDISKVRIFGIGTATAAALIHQANAINQVNGLQYSGVPYTTFTDVNAKVDKGEYALLTNLSTTVTFNAGDQVASASLAAAATDGTNTGTSAAIVGTWVCMGYAPPNKTSLFKRIK